LANALIRPPIPDTCIRINSKPPRDAAAASGQNRPGGLTAEPLEQLGDRMRTAVAKSMQLGEVVSHACGMGQRGEAAVLTVRKVMRYNARWHVESAKP
jgi:hypothetical protein